MKIKTGMKIHNRFDIEVKDILTGEIVKRAEAENILLNNFFSTNGLFYSGAENYARSKLLGQIHFGEGTGTLSPSRTTLFSSLGVKDTTYLERKVNIDTSIPSYIKGKIVILPSEQIGKTIKEVGFGMMGLCSHALLKDSEGNSISIGPKKDTEEITIYATIYYTFSLPDGVVMLDNANSIKRFLFGEINSFELMQNNQSVRAKNKNASEMSQYPSSKLILDVVNRKIKTPRMRFNSIDANGRIWGLNWYYFYPAFSLTFPCSSWQGYHFEGKNIDVGNGSTTKFILPWSDINTTKEYKIYVDGVLKSKDVDYTLANSETETSVTFTSAPASNAVVTGDWWVDYIPKDTNHVLDVEFILTFGEGA